MLVFAVSTSLYAKEEYSAWVNQSKQGNFALPTSQQPGPLISFGQNIVDKGDFQLYSFFDYIRGQHKNSKEIIPYLLYGIREDLSLLVGLPIQWLQANGNRESGLGDLAFQGEYVVYEKDTFTSTYQVTLVGAITAPTGSVAQVVSRSRAAALGFGSPSFFIGVTSNYYATDWLWWISLGGVLTTQRDGTKFGNEGWYQAGFGRNIIGKKDCCIITWMVEATGFYDQHARIDGILDCNTGGNSITITPSLWFSTRRFIAQFGVGYVAYQHLFGQQQKNRWLVALDVGWKFNSPKP